MNAGEFKFITTANLPKESNRIQELVDGKNIYYDCENKTWVRGEGEDKEPHQFYTDYICSEEEDVIADCFQSWGKCKSTGDEDKPCKRDYEIKSQEISGIDCQPEDDVQRYENEDLGCINYKPDPNEPEKDAN